MNRRMSLGRQGEDAACAYLEEQGMEILERNYYQGHGEIDIIARDGIYTVFVEVKTRANEAYGSGLEGITRKKQNVLYRTAEAYAASHGLLESPLRFDVVEVQKTNGQFCLKHIKNAEFTGC